MPRYLQSLELPINSEHKEPLRGSLSRRAQNKSDARAIFRRSHA